MADARASVAKLAASPAGQKAIALNSVAERTTKNWQRSPIYQALDNFAALPSEGVLNVMGAQQRVVASRLGNWKTNPIGVLGATMDNFAPGSSLYLTAVDRDAPKKIQQQYGNDLYAVFHPNDPRIENNMYHATGIDKAMTNDPRFRGKLQNAAVATAAQIISDPTTYETAGAGAAAEILLGKWGQLMTDAARSENPLTRNLASTFTTNVEERSRQMTSDELAEYQRLASKKALNAQDPTKDALTKKEQAKYAKLGDQIKLSDFNRQQMAAVNVARTKNQNFQYLWDGRYRKWIDQDKKNIDANILSPLTQQRLMIEPYLFGSPGMRADAIKNGFDVQAAIKRGDVTWQEVTDALQGKGPEVEAVKYKVQDMYNPQSAEVRQPAGSRFNSMLVGENERYRMKTSAGFEKYKEDQQAKLTDATLRDRLTRRFQAGRTVVGNRAMVKSLESQLGIGEAAAKTFLEKTVFGSFNLAETISNIQTDAMLSIGLPHIRNIGVLGYLAMGERGMAAAMYRFLTKVPDRLSGRLVGKGGEAYFAPKTLPEKSPVRLMPYPVRQAASNVLNKFDLAVRATRLEMLDKSNPELSEVEKLNRVNQDIGDYATQPHYVRLAKRTLGGNFPQWHGYIVPTAVMRAALRNPGNVTRLARYEQNFNDYVLPNSKYRLTLGGGLDEDASAWADLARIATGHYPSYFASQSMIGPAADVLHPLISKGVDLRKEVAAGALQAVPLGLPLGEAFLNEYKEPGKGLSGAAGRFGLSLLGPYWQKRTIPSRRRLEDIRQGLGGTTPTAATTKSNNPLAAGWTGTQ